MANDQFVIARFRCPFCEAWAVETTDLGYIGDDGAIGTIAGFACRSCHFIRQAPDAVPTVRGHVELDGQTAAEWFVDRLQALGCRPRQRA